MLDDAIFDGLGEIKKMLKKKYPKASDRYALLLLMALIVIIPLVLFDYWLGRIAGIILISLFFLSIAASTKKDIKNKS